jgi:glycosyltransferase involved in cell wall biosynthesis
MSDVREEVPDARGREPSGEGASRTATPRPVRALFLNDTSRNGGPGRTLFYILKFLDTTRIHRTVIVPRAGVVSELLLGGKVVDDLHFLPNLVENVVEPWDRAIERDDFAAPLPLRALRAVGNVARGTSAVFELLSLVRSSGAEVVFCNGTTANFAGGAIARMTDVPVVWHAFYPEVARPIAALHARLAASPGVRAILCVSKPIAKQFEHCKEKVRVVHDAIDTDEFAPQAAGNLLRKEMGFDEHTVVFGAHGRILPRKGFLEMVRAARIAMDQLPADVRARTRFVVLGDTPSDMRPDHLEECRAEVKKLGLEESFFFIGYRSDVKAFVNDFSVEVVPSIYEDPLPRAVIEAMSFAKPVIAFDVGGIPEMIDDGQNGILVRGHPPDVDGLAAAFVRYAGDAELRRKHGEAARRRAVEHFDSRAHAKRMQDELLRVVRR